MTKKIRGVTFEENLSNSMGLEFYNLSHRFGYQSPNWPSFEGSWKRVATEVITHFTHARFARA